MFTDEDHDDVELMLNCTGPEILELIASDPKRYLNIVSTYNKTRDGREIYLSDLFNIIITRNDNEYRIKFKTHDNGNWYEVGYSGGSYDEDDVHEAFSKKVQYAINRPVDSHRAAIMDTLQPSGSVQRQQAPAEPQESFFETSSASASVTSGFMKPQGDQTKLTKIDRFMNRTSCVPSVAPVSPVATVAPVAPAVPVVVASTSSAPVVPVAPVASASSGPLAPVAQRPSVLSELDILRTLCPDERLAEYERLVSVIRSDDGFYQSLVELLPRLSGGQRLLLTNFLLN